jgi:hypothetical protein
MMLGKWLILVGGGCLALGLASALWSSRETRQWADEYFVVGLVLTLLGVGLHTLGSLLP